MRLDLNCTDWKDHKKFSRKLHTPSEKCSTKPVFEEPDKISIIATKTQ